MVKSKENLIAAWAFLVGIVLAILIGIFAQSLTGMANNIMYISLVVIGCFVGYLIMGDKTSNTFLIASLALVIVSGLGNNSLLFIANLSPILDYLVRVLAALLVMFIPATIVVALKTVFSITEI